MFSLEQVENKVWRAGPRGGYNPTMDWWVSGTVRCLKGPIWWCEPGLKNKERERGGERIVQNNFQTFSSQVNLKGSQRIISYFSPLEDVTLCPEPSADQDVGDDPWTVSEVSSASTLTFTFTTYWLITSVSTCISGLFKSPRDTRQTVIRSPDQSQMKHYEGDDECHCHRTTARSSIF